MKRFIAVVEGTLLSLFLSAFALGAPSEHLDWGQQLSSGASACPSGTLVINVTQKILNDADSGVDGNAWAYDDIVRHIQVVAIDSDLYCATVKYQGNFTTNDGASPGGTGFVGEGVVGTFEGGYVSVPFSATLLATPLARAKGSIGTRDYACVDFDCPGYLDWTTLYFNGGAAFDYAWWGWVYHAGNNGSWTNASTGNSGDITGN